MWTHRVIVETPTAAVTDDGQQRTVLLHRPAAAAFSALYRTKPPPCFEGNAQAFLCFVAARL